jgi:hypothetical protein
LIKVFCSIIGMLNHNLDTQCSSWCFEKELRSVNISNSLRKLYSTS